MSFRLRLTALLLLLTMLTAPMSVFAAPTANDPCVATQHDCDVPTVIECCCDDASRSGPATPAEQRVTVTAAAMLTAPAVFDAVSVVRVHPHIDHVNGFSPRTCLLDLPTLFATLLI